MKKLLIVVLFAIFPLVAPKFADAKGNYEIIVFSKRNGTLDLVMNQKYHRIFFTKGENPPVYIEMTKINFVHVWVKLQGSKATSRFVLFPSTAEKKYDVELGRTSMSLTTKLVCAPGYDGSYCELGQGILTTTPKPDDRLDWESSTELDNDDSNTINPNDTPTVNQKAVFFETQGNDAVESRFPEQEPANFSTNDRTKGIGYNPLPPNHIPPTKFLLIVLSILLGIVSTFRLVQYLISCCFPRYDDIPYMEESEMLPVIPPRDAVINSWLLRAAENAGQKDRESVRIYDIYESLGEVEMPQNDNNVQEFDRVYWSDY